MADPVVDLAMTGASTIVAAMATGAWQAVRDGVVRLFRGHGHAPPAIEAQLDADAELVERDEDPDDARQDLAAGWRRRLARLLAERPEAEADLRALMEQVGELLPQAPRAWVQTNVARHGGQVFAAQGGNVFVHRAAAESSQEPATGADADALP